MAFWAWAMSFPTWTCHDDGCGQSVEWLDAAYIVEDGKLVGVRHRGHVDV